MWDKPIAWSFGERLRVLMRFKGMTALDLSEKLDVSTTVVTEWINDVTIPEALQQREIATFLEVRVSVLDPSNLVLEAPLIQLGYRNGSFLLLESDAIERLIEASSSETLERLLYGTDTPRRLVVEADFGKI